MTQDRDEQQPPFDSIDELFTGLDGTTRPERS